MVESFGFIGLEGVGLRVAEGQRLGVKVSG